MTLALRIALGTLLLASAAAAQEAVQEKTQDPHAALVERLGDADFAERTRAYDALRAAGKDAREALRAGARSEDAEVKWSCRRLLRLLEAGPGEGEGRPTVLRFGEGPAPMDDEAFRGTLESLRERMEELERDFEARELELRPLVQGLPGGEGIELHAISEQDGERIEVNRGKDGRVKVTLTRKGEDGASKTETFEAESMEALEKEHPDAHAKVKPLLNVRRGRIPGGFRLEIPAIGELPRFDRIPRPDGTFEFHPAGRPVLGVGVSPVPPVLRTQLELPEDEGIVVEEVRPDSLAARLDVRRHDVILRVNGVPVSTAGDVRAAVEAVKEGGAVRLDVLRAGKKTVLTGTR